MQNLVTLKGGVNHRCRIRYLIASSLLPELYASNLMDSSKQRAMVASGQNNPSGANLLSSALACSCVSHNQCPMLVRPHFGPQKKARETMKVVNAEAIAELLSRAAASPRKRMNLNLHAGPSDAVGRFLNAGIAGTYVRPHRHRIDRWELVTVLKGRFDVVIFTSEGMVKSRAVLGSPSAHVAEISGGEWHGVVFHAPLAVVLEVKAGPYEPHLDKEFASWAPAENDPAVARFVNWLETAKPGDFVPRQ
jgi:cupin fold WbuC family metalloprotein